MNQSPEHSVWYRALIIIGGFALLGAMAVDVVAVIGRAIQVPLLGSIELVQYVVGIAGSLAMIVATLNRRHAVVMILYNRFSGTMKSVAGLVNGLCATLFFLALLAGSLWLLADLWQGYEESELWHLPYRPLRLLMAGALLIVACIFLVQAIMAGRRKT